MPPWSSGDWWIPWSSSGRGPKHHRGAILAGIHLRQVFLGRSNLGSRGRSRPRVLTIETRRRRFDNQCESN